jgi:anaerobic ribonucleoside-triphosphate reductase activating protein
MTDLIWTLDPATGQILVEGVSAEEARALASDLLPPNRELTCARPLSSALLPTRLDPSGPAVRVARIYHGSAIEGPGRRSVVQLQGCPIGCKDCAVPETHDPSGGVALGIADVIRALLDPGGEPRDGVTILGGEPFLQPVGLAALLRALRRLGIHTVVYSGYTIEALRRRAEAEVQEALELADLLIDGPFVSSLATGSGPWTGSTNQRVIEPPKAAPPRRVPGWKCLVSRCLTRRHPRDSSPSSPATTTR